MRLFIAEKPSVAKVLAAELGVTSKEEGYIVCGLDKVTWCFGHMLEQAEPDTYTPDDAPTNPKTGKKLWRIDDLPIIPGKWILNPKPDAKKQLAVIKTLLKEASSIVNAGDSDREGQLLVDEIVKHYKNNKPVLRFWVSAHDPLSLQRGLANLKNNADYAGLGVAALARSRADWLIGMNLSRAFTLAASRAGTPTLLPVGRVQTPTLAMVVARDRSIDDFKSAPFYTIKAAFTHEKGSFIGHWKAGEDQPGLDGEGRLITQETAHALITRLNGKKGIIKTFDTTLKKLAHPKAYSLSDITLVASNRFGYSAEEVLNSCQSLYETHKLTSYPRTDCGYLPESQHADAPAILKALKQINPEFEVLLTTTDASIKSKTWDDQKIGVHHGIIPTQYVGDRARLNEKERCIYDLIVRAYIAQFLPTYDYMSTTIFINVEEELFETRGKIVVNLGWKAGFQEDNQDKEGEDTLLPAATKGDSVQCIKAQCLDNKTKPPSRFTEGTLQRAMENIHLTITDLAHKQLLREGDGIGTPATRASIISELRRRELLEARGKNIVSTTKGQRIIDALPEVVKNPLLTALYERMLQEIEKTPSKLDAFIQQQVDFVTQQVALANNSKIAIGEVKIDAVVSSQFFCERCNKGLMRRARKKGFWWACSGYPSCKEAYSDQKGAPNYLKKTL